MESASNPTDRWMRVASTLAILVSAAIIWSAFCGVPRIQWNPPRLAPAFALTKGLNIYATSTSGAQLGWCYGPIFPIFSLPATLASNITVAFWIWSGLNLLAICWPVWLVLREGLGSCRQAWIGLPLYLILFLANPTTGSMIHFIHVDALCSGLELIACWCMYRAARRGEGFTQCAALSAVLAIFTKQLAISLIPALVGWLWWQGRRELITRFLFWLTIYGGGLTGIFFLWFGGEELIANLVVYQMYVPRKGGIYLIFLETIRLFFEGWIWLIVVTLKFYGHYQRPSVSSSSSLETLLLWVAVFHVPLGVRIITGVGGGLNSMYCLYFFLPVLTVWLISLAACHSESNSRGWLVPGGCVVLIVVLLAIGNICYLESREGLPPWKPDRGQEQALQTAREGRGRVYFPWNPLVTIISDGKIYPFDDALRWLYAVGQAPTRDVVQAAVPAHPIIIYTESAQSKFALNYFQSVQPVTAKN